jgi:hypothetical protein
MGPLYVLLDTGVVKIPALCVHKPHLRENACKVGLIPNAFVVLNASGFDSPELISVAVND